MRIDIHQHLLPEPLVAALARRTSSPRVVRDGAGWALQIEGERKSAIVGREHDPGARSLLVAEDGLERALIALSSVLGVESLPDDEARPLIDAYEAGVAALPEQFGHWSALPLGEHPDPAGADAAAESGAAGLCLPAGALATERGLDRLGPLLARLASGGRPLFVHPGPDPLGPVAGAPAPRASWFLALTAYVAQMGAAWHTFIAHGRAQHPNLRVVFAMLAGLAPLHHERLVARGGPATDRADPQLFYDISSYGPQAVDAVAHVVGPHQLVFGSDRPVITPDLVAHPPAQFERAASRLLRPPGPSG